MTGTRQRGVALLTALLVVALGTLLATAAFQELALDARRGQNALAAEQAYQFGQGMEFWARSVLADDYADSGLVDHRGEIWAHALPAIHVEGGRLIGRMDDLNGRFNVNNLVIGGKRQEAQIAMFRRLLTLLGLDPALAEAVVDWQDGDLFPGQRGAEDGEYLRRKPAYRTANRDLFHVSELRAVAGIDETAWRRLEPHVIALPVNETPTPVNINTATPPVLAALDDRITLAMAESLYQEGRAQHETLQSFLEQPQLQGLVSPELSSRIAVGSRYFLAHGVVEIGDLLQHYYAVIERNGPASRTIYHSRGVF